MKTFWTGMMAAGLVLASLGTAQGDPPDVYRETINSVVWIVNYLPGRGVITGSGVLVDRERKLVVTCYHVADDEDTMDVYFAAYDGEGDVIYNRDYYLEGRSTLRRIGYAAVGRVVARDKEKDLAILRLGSVPAGAEGVSLADSDPEEDDCLHMIGNPGCRDLFRWAPGRVRTIEQYENTYDDGHSVDLLALRFFSSAYGGNSGGPVLNDDSELVGICHAGGTANGGMSATAIHYREVKDLLESVRRYRVFSIANRTQDEIHYWVRYGSRRENETLQAGYCRVYRLTADMTPEIGFDHSFAEGYQERKYTLQTYTANYGRGCSPDREADAREYAFRLAGNGINLYSDE